MNKQKKYGAFEVFDSKNQSIKVLERQIRRDYGDPCGLYEPNCFGCKVWSAWVVLNNILEATKRPTKNDRA